MKYFLALILLCVNVFAEGVRIKTEREEGTWHVSGGGTGCFIEKHRVLTAWHVVEKGRLSVEVDGKWHAAKVIRHDEEADIALLECKAAKGNVVKLADEKLIVCVSDGGGPVVERRIECAAGAFKGLTKDGNSGGPMLNGKGELVGIVLSRSVNGKSGFFVSVETIREFLGK